MRLGVQRTVVRAAGRTFVLEPPVASPLILSRRLPVNRRRKGHVPRKRTPHTQGPPAPLAPHNGESEAVLTSAVAVAVAAVAWLPEPRDVSDEVRWQRALDSHRRARARMRERQPVRVQRVARQPVE